MIFVLNNPVGMPLNKEPKIKIDELVGFYGISTIVGYLKLNPLYTYILNI